MRLVVKTLYYLILTALFATLVYGTLWWILFSRSLPTYSDSRSFERLDARVEIVRDTHNVPHVFASSEMDAYFALGFAHAQDRLWQMEIARRTAQGRLSEIFGPSRLDHDRLMRHLNIFRNAQTDVGALDARSRSILEAYSNGVNGYLSSLTTDARGRGAPEFFFLSPAISPWRPADSLSIFRHMSWMANTSLETERLQARVTLGIGRDRADELFRHDPSVPSPSGTAIALASPRTVTGGTLLIADYAAPLTAPTQLYIARLSAAETDVIGATVPGLPLFLVGQSNTLAWSFHIEDRNNLDISIVPDDLLVDAAERVERIPIFDAPTSIEPIRMWSGGHVIGAAVIDMTDLVPAQHQVVIQWAGNIGADRSFAALSAITTAANVEDATPQPSDIVAPIRVTLADQTAIRTRSYGLLPSRSPWQGQRTEIPYLVERPEAMWNGVSPIEKDVEDTPISVAISTGRNPFQRQRLDRLISEREIHSLLSLRDIQLDTVSDVARALLPVVARELWFSELPAPSDPLSSTRSTALDLLADWNGEMSEHLPQPLIYSAWMWELQRQIIRDELGPLTRHFADLRPGFLQAVFTNQDDMGTWCDIVPSEAIETCEEIALRSLNVALLNLTDTYGDRIDSWLWGDAHQAYMGHPLFPRDSMMDWIAGIYQPVSGDAHTVQQTYTASVDGVHFVTTNAASARMIVDTSGVGQSGIITATGQSGHFLSEFYDDFTRLWRRGEYLPLSFDEDLARSGAVGVTTLEPAQN
ncbi:MAG: penicillin acylase family protein [Pseudomonadota bacterium]